MSLLKFSSARGRTICGLRGPGSSRQESLADAGPRQPGLDLLPQGVRLHLLLVQIGVDLRLVPQAVGDGVVHVRELQRWIFEDDLLRAGAVVEGANHRVQGDARVADTDRTAVIEAQRRG